jgi:hypothetical protein
MSIWQALPLARAGALIRRSAWENDSALRTQRIACVAGAGTTRAVWVRRQSGVDTVVTASIVGQADFLADDWEVVT